MGEILDKSKFEAVKHANKKVFGERMTEAFNAWQTKTGKNLKAFEYEENGKKQRMAAAQISRYKSGANKPSVDTFVKLCAEFRKVDEALGDPYFYCQVKPFVLYRIDRKVQAEIDSFLLGKAAEIGLSPSFLQYIATCTDFQKQFEPWSPMVTDPNKKRTGNEFAVYTRMRTAGIDFEEPGSVFRVGNGKISSIDLEALKELQDSISDFVEYWYYSRSIKMAAALEKGNVIRKGRIIEECAAAGVPVEQSHWGLMDDERRVALTVKDLKQIDVGYGSYYDNVSDDTCILDLRTK